MPHFRSVLLRVYTAFAGLSWWAVGVLVFSHYAISGVGFLLADEKVLIADFTTFTYFWMVTSSTLGYGDMSPVTPLGRWILTIWMVPIGVSLFGVVLAKIVETLSTKFRKRMNGMANYENLTDHTVIIGWQGDESRRMILQLSADNDREIVLVSKNISENPMPDHLKFVHGTSLTGEDVHTRSAVRAAARIIVFGETDDETMAAGLAAYGKTRTDTRRVEHIVTYFRKDSSANIFREHCPTAEVFVNPSVELMVRACADPGATRVTNKLLNALDGPTQYSIVVPDGVSTTYGELFTEFKNNVNVNATLFGVASTVTGDDLILNADHEHIVNGGNILYFMANRRVKPNVVNWSSSN